MLAAVCGALFWTASRPGASVEERRPFDAWLDDILTLRISQGGLDYLAKLLGDGLEQPGLRQEIVDALEGQSFEVLVPQLGDRALIVVDYAEGTPNSQLDGFRYDQVGVSLTTVPQLGALRPEPGVLYPIIDLYGWSGGTVDTDFMPELHVVVYYPSGNTIPIRAVAYGRLRATGLLRPYIGDGTLSVMVEEFQTRLDNFNIAWVSTPGASPVLLDALGEVLIEDARKELEDALSDVLMGGLNDILFDRDQDGEADTLLDLKEVFLMLNDWLGTDFGFAMTPEFQTNATLPTTVYLRTGGSMFLETPGECVGPDVDDGFVFTRLEQDGIFGHDPPQLSMQAPASGIEAQFALALSDDFLNQVAFNAYRTGLACFFFDPSAPGMPSEVTELMNTGTLGVLTGRWLQDLAPDAPVGFRMRLLEAPRVTIPPEGDIHLRFEMPDLQFDLLVQLEGRWVRLMGARAAIRAGIGVEALRLSGGPLVDLVLDLDVENRVGFADLVPERRDDLQNLLPTAMSLVEGAAADIVNLSPGDLTACVEGIDVGLFEAAPMGIDPSGDLAHYLALWISLTGTTDLARLFECLLGEPLVTAPAVAAAPGADLADASRLPRVQAPGTAMHRAADLAGEPVQRWRFVPGFVHSGAAPVPALPAGERAWSWQDSAGAWHTVRLVGGAAPEPLPDHSRWACGVAPDGASTGVWLPLLLLVGVLALRRTRRHR